MIDRLDTNQHMKEIFNTINDGMILISPEGIILMVNRAMEEISGYKKEELTGRSCSLLGCDACRQSRSEGKGHWCELFEAGHARRKPCFLMRKDGSYLHVLKNASLLRDAEEKVLGAIETLTDISGIDMREERIHQLSRLLEESSSFCGMLGRSPGMKKVFELIGKAAQGDAPVIIHGETGTGKELVAHAIHSLGKRKEGPYIQLNCAALNEGLLESELFGHVKGAFTGAYRQRQGRFEAANGGDIFLDEVGDVPLSIQVKLLRILENKQFERVGDHHPIKVDVRVITATNRNLDQLVSEGKFREDFFFRINAIPIHLPSLRERIEDVPLLTEHFIHQLRSKTGKPILGLSADAMELLMCYSWPGNIRELRGVLDYAFVVAEEGLIHLDHLPAHIEKPAKTSKSILQNLESSPLDERSILVDALIKCGGNQLRAARLLGVNRVTVWHRIKKHGIDVRELKKSAPSMKDSSEAEPPRVMANLL
jgi:two-component system response regulator HydG